MKRLLLLLLLGLQPLLALAEPQVLVEAQLVPEGKALVGGTLNLQVDVLTDTWFTEAPQLPKLDLPGAQVTPPSSEALHLNLQREGTTFFGLRFTYQITPNQAQQFQIPPLPIQTVPGQGSGPVTVQTVPLDFVASQPEGVAEGQQVLMARNLKFTQQIEPSHSPLRVGDSVVRRLTLEAEGAQAMRLPAPPFEEVEGLQRYVKTPQVGPLDDGRGNVSGGRRVDEVSYVIDQPGAYQLPAIELQWWDMAANQMRTATVPAQDIEASAEPAYQAPFSIAEDLRALGQSARIHIAQYWLLLAALLVLGGLVIYWGLPWWRRGSAAWRAWRSRRQQTYLQSAAFAWQQVAQQLRGRPAQVGALYLWGRRSLDARTLGAVARKISDPSAQRLLTFLKSNYGSAARPEEALAALQQALPELKRSALRQQPSAPGQGLLPINPRQPVAGSTYRDAR
ncbi:BatD family protein [Pseudomonas sp. BMS12]|uniref:BatD family protein n=1 Tax=Pseudomonas sp. BMS12 TaxID=1796033 RepID=UPI00083B0D1F|nr:BatD family protein [Pseudomonas sp. BMS12]